VRTIILRSVVLLALVLALVPHLRATAQGTATLSGHVTDVQGAPLAGARITMRGPSTYTTTTDAAGSFSVSSVTPGVYSVNASRAGYNSATEVIAFVAGQSQKVTVALQQISFTRLVTIAHVSTTGAGAFNASPASVNVVSAQAFTDQAAPQVRDVLNEIPGLQISYPGGSSDAAAPGSITVPTIRGAASYETASLIDGHPLAVEDYGDYVTTFLSSYMFGDVEVVKGPGATAPEVNYAINGTVDFHTKDPTLTFVPDYQFGYTNIGGTIADFGVSDTIGKFGFIVAISNVNNPSVLNNKRVYIDPSFYYLQDNANTGTILDGHATYTQVPNTEAFLQTGYSLLACCFTEEGYLNNTSELLKLRYSFSPSTHVTIAYLGGQSFADQTGNVGNATNATFLPNSSGIPGYTGPLASGPIQVMFLYPANFETNNEPIFEGEFATTVGNDTVLARYYHASIYRLVSAGPVAGLSGPGVPSYLLGTAPPTGLAQYTMNLYGTSENNFFMPTVYNGPSTLIYNQNFFREVEQDKLTGWSAEWDHPFGVGDDVSLAVDQTSTQSLDYELVTYQSITLPQGSGQIFTTGQLRAVLNITPKLEMTLADYYNVYRSQYPARCPFSGGFSACAIDGSNVTFNTATTRHNDPRVALEFRPGPNVAIRAAAGSAIAPPYLGLLEQISPGVATYNPSTGFATITQNNPNLKPETAFGYDVGADYRLGDGLTVISADGYLNNLFNHYFGQTTYSGTVCGAPIPCTVSGGGTVPPGTKVYYSTNTNISSFRFEGVELSINRHPRVGIGYTLAAGVQRGYVYNLPVGFYCSSPVPSCINNPSNWNQNLNIIAGQNLNGEGITYASTIGSLNTREPYSQGYGALSYAFADGSGYAEFGETYYGNNNSFNQRPFFVAHASLRVPIAPLLSLEIAGFNVFNTLPGVFPIYGGGLPIPLANGAVAGGCPGTVGNGCGSDATVANVLGPAVYTVMLTKRFDTP
jgi:outer membrane receptor protein involved in Fe transport